ncbi:MAG: Na+/H+ antiporter NhaC family protein, partial [Planctomycetaceae bacterium]
MPSLPPGLLIVVSAWALFSPTGWTAESGDLAQIIFDGPHAFPQGTQRSELTFRALDNQGNLLETWSEQVSISGFSVRCDGTPRNSDLQPFAGEVSFDGGLLRITPESLAVDQIVGSSEGISIHSDTQEWHFPVSVRPSWLRLLPPILAIAFAVLFKDVVSALILAIFGGCLLFFPVTESYLAIPVFCETMVRQVADHDHASVVLFTLLLGAMIGLMNDSGGTRGAVDWLAGFARTRRRGMSLTWIMGLFVFFDDYANSMLIGGAMRPLSDRLKFSRAKLAFLIDSTAAPIAGLAISTWTAFEIDLVVTEFKAAGIDANAASFFWSTVPFRIYPILMIAVAGAVALSGRDFGAMLQAEQNQHRNKPVPPVSGPRGSVLLAAVPVLSLVVISVTGFILEVDAYKLLLIGSFVASSLAVLLALAFSPLSLEDCSRSWMAGVGTMIPAVVILVLAWGVSAVCRIDQLDTAGYIMGVIGNSVRPELLPTIAFVTAGTIAAAIGSSFATMALLMPMVMQLAWNLLGGPNNMTLRDPVSAATIGAILAGAIFGDHCSPISDTTVLSSAAAGCEHLQHVATQLPY